MHMPDPTFPPLLEGHDVKGGDVPFEVACARAAAGALGAGDVVWSRNTSRIDLAIVLEPEVALERAVEMLPLALVAAGDCLGALTPPQVGVSFTWPNIIRINGAVAGEVRAAVGEGRAGRVPDWLVLGLTLRHTKRSGEQEPGHTPDATWLSEEGGADVTRTAFIESYCRHFLTWINTWNDDGFRPVHESWLFRAHDRDRTVQVPNGDGVAEGRFLGLDDGGNLLLKRADGSTVALQLADRFERGAPL